MVFVRSLIPRSGFDLKGQRTLEAPPGALRAADVLSYGSIMFSTPASLAPMCVFSVFLSKNPPLPPLPRAADYNCRLPSNTSKAKVFFLTFFGLLVAMMTSTIWSAILMTVPTYSEAYVNAGGPVAVLSKVFEPWGRGGKFILVLITLSAVGNNIPNTCMFLFLFSMNIKTPRQTLLVLRCKRSFRFSTRFPVPSLPLLLSSFTLLPVLPVVSI